MNEQDIQYIEAIMAGEQEKADEIASQIMNKYVECISSVKVNSFEMPFFTAAIKLAGETMYNSMDEDSRKVCNTLMRRTTSTMFTKPAKGGGSDE